MSNSALARRITQFGFDLLGSDLALDARTHVFRELSPTGSSIMWARDDPNGSLIIDNPPRILDYLALLERKDYSYLMFDGAIIQISYVFDEQRIVRHRLLHYPCPFSVDTKLLDDFDVGLADLIREIYMDDMESSIVLRTPVRFDYAPEAAADFHPASHVTINELTCRIPVRSPMRFDQFMRFILEHFYPHALREPKIAMSILAEFDVDCLSEHDRGRIHFTWPNA